MRRSGLQIQVLQLYRSLLRAVRSKPIESRDHFRIYVQHHFRREAGSVGKPVVVEKKNDGREKEEEHEHEHDHDHDHDHPHPPSPPKLSVKDIDTIEFLLRKGNKQLEMLKRPDVVDISVPEEMRIHARFRSLRKE